MKRTFLAVIQWFFKLRDNCSAMYCSSEVWYIRGQMRRKTLKHRHHSQLLWLETARDRTLEILGQSEWGREHGQEWLTDFIHYSIDRNCLRWPRVFLNPTTLFLQTNKLHLVVVTVKHIVTESCTSWKWTFFPLTAESLQS